MLELLEFHKQILVICVKRFYPFFAVFHLSVKLYFTHFLIGKTYNFFFANLAKKTYLSSYLFVSTLQYTLFGFQ